MPLARLEKWLGSVGINIEVEKVRIRVRNGGLGVFAVSDVTKSDLLCTIPKAAVLSVKTSGIADLLEENRIRGGLGLIIAIMYEMSIKTASPWHGYLSELSSREYLPMFWTEEELGLLQGTAVAQNATEDLQHTQEDFETHVLPLVEQHPTLLKAGVFTLSNFRKAASWVASRAFGVDSHHGMSLVPLADIFNHKAAIVQLSDEYAIEPICFEDGEESSGCSDESDGNSGASGSEDETAAHCGDANCQEPGCHHEHHGGAANSRGSLLQELDSAAAQEHQLEIGICGASREDGEEILQIMAASSIPKGAEVHNTYGELGNADLLSKYGFALRQNPFSAVVLSKASVLQAAEKLIGQRELRLRSRLLRKESELLDEDSEPFEVLPDSCIGPSLAVALFTIFADSQLFTQWRDMDDAVRSMQQASRSLSVTAEKHAPAEDGLEEVPKADASSRKRKREALSNSTDEQHPGRHGVQRRGKHPCSGSSEHRNVGNGVSAADDSAQREVSEEHVHGEEPWQPSLIMLSKAPEALINSTTAACLRAALQDHLDLYKEPTLAVDVERLRVAEQQCELLYRDEHWKARASALRLIVQEKEILHDALQALHGR